MAEGTALLEVSGLTRRYGGVTAVDHLDLQLAMNESLGVIGPNGAGKSTFIGLVSGAIKPSEGRVVLDGRDVSSLGAAHRTRLGIGRTHQIPRPFGGMTVLENLVLAGRHATHGRESLRSTTNRCRDILDRTGLAENHDTLGGRLPLLKRKRLEMARALALRPRILLLDEIGAGLVEHEVAELIELIQQLRHEVDGLIVIEHVMDVITGCCDRAAVLDFGKLIAEGETRSVLADETVAAVYLGTASEHHRDKTEARNAQPVATTTAIDLSDTKLNTPPQGDGLVVRDVEVSYGGVRALRGVTIEVRPGEVVSLLGANGAGKTTLSNVISGVVVPDGGELLFNGESILRHRPDQITAGGIAHCMEGRKIFATLSVEENLRLAAGRATTAEVKQRLTEVYNLFPILSDRRSGPGTAMSGGQQQMLAIGRALMTAPQLVIFDEISLGLAPVVVDVLYDALDRLQSTGLSMLLVEQNLERGLSLADRAYVLAHGHVALSGTPEEIRNQPTLLSLYVGEAGDDEPNEKEGTR